MQVGLNVWHKTTFQHQQRPGIWATLSSSSNWNGTSQTDFGRCSAEANHNANRRRAHCHFKDVPFSSARRHLVLQLCDILQLPEPKRCNDRCHVSRWGVEGSLWRPQSAAKQEVGLQGGLMEHKTGTVRTDGLNRMITTAPFPLAINLFSPWRSLQSDAVIIPSLFFHPTFVKIWFFFQDMASLSGEFCSQTGVCQRGVSLVRHRAIKQAHARRGGLARGKCHRGGSNSAKKSFPLSFCLPNYIIEKATQQGTLGGCPVVLWGEATEG